MRLNHRMSGPLSPADARGSLYHHPGRSLHQTRDGMTVESARYLRMGG